jgi:hypothetical protein
MSLDVGGSSFALSSLSCWWRLVWILCGFLELAAELVDVANVYGMWSYQEGWQECALLRYCLV